MLLCRISFVIMLNVVRMSDVMQNVMLIVYMLYAVMLSVVLQNVTAEYCYAVIC